MRTAQHAYPHTVGLASTARRVTAAMRFTAAAFAVLTAGSIALAGCSPTPTTEPSSAPVDETPDGAHGSPYRDALLTVADMPEGWSEADPGEGASPLHGDDEYTYDPAICDELRSGLDTDPPLTEDVVAFTNPEDLGVFVEIVQTWATPISDAMFDKMAADLTQCGHVTTLDSNGNVLLRTVMTDLAWPSYGTRSISIRSVSEVHLGGDETPSAPITLDQVATTTDPTGTTTITFIAGAVEPLDPLWVQTQMSRAINRVTNA